MQLQHQFRSVTLSATGGEGRGEAAYFLIAIGHRMGAESGVRDAANPQPLTVT